jgi:Ni/Co efflux regulator RcnB
MKRNVLITKFAVALAIAAMLTDAPAIAQKPSWAADGKGGKSESRETPGSQQGGKPAPDAKSPRDAGRAEVRVREYFGDQHRTYAQDYFREEFQRGRCPPGLAKKQNGCMPPGQAKKWTVGRPLPRDVIFHDLPPSLMGRFGPPPAGYRYVRVASDILLIAIGTGMVIDALQDLGRMQ